MVRIRPRCGSRNVRSSRPAMQRPQPSTSRPSIASKPASTNNRLPANKPQSTANTVPAKQTVPQAATENSGRNPFFDNTKATPPSKPDEVQQLINRYNSPCGTKINRGHGTYEQAAIKAAQKLNPELDKTVNQLEKYVKSDEFTDWFKDKLGKEGFSSVTGENRAKLEQEVNKKIETYMEKQGYKGKLEGLAEQYGNSQVMNQLNPKAQAHANGQTLLSRIAADRPCGMIGKRFNAESNKTRAIAEKAMTPVFENYIKSYVGSKLKPTVESSLTKVGAQHTLSKVQKNIGSLFSKFKGL
ncbi:MAG: hypothetical protein AB1782_04805 [Cyanobacteriota bacterium]